MITGIPVMDQGQPSDGLLKAHVGFLHPQAMIFRGSTFAELRANICGQCGYTELFADNPEVLYEAYARTHGDSGGRT